MRSLRRLLDILLPPTCAFCGLDADGLCSACRNDLPENRLACPVCAKPVPQADTLCAACVRRRPPFHTVIAPLRYAFPVDAALKALKFRARFCYVPALSEVLVEACERLPGDVDAILPMPMHWRRRALRGFNQAEEFAAPVARHLGLPVLRHVSRCRYTRYQSGLDAVDRRRNVARAFRVRGPLRGRHVLVVDDILTTGHTSASLAHELRRAGAVRVSVLVVARA